MFAVYRATLHSAYQSLLDHRSAINFGVALVARGVAATVLSGIAHWFALRPLRRDEAPMLSRWPKSFQKGRLVDRQET
jgi:hypothetical protein